jgi:hypothetical protein
MPIQDPLMPAEPGPFYTPRETEYDCWDEPQIIGDPLRCRSGTLNTPEFQWCVPSRG